MLARLKRLEKLVSDAEARLLETIAVADALAVGGDDATKARDAVVGLTLALERHRANRDRTRELWERLAPVRQQLDERKGTIQGRRKPERPDD